MMPTVLNGAGAESGKASCQREGNVARAAETMLGVLQAAVQI